MMCDSVMALIDRGNGDCDHLPLDAGELAFSMHQLDVHVVVNPQHLGMHSVDPQDVVVIVDLRFGGNLIFFKVPDECHERPFVNQLVRSVDSQETVAIAKTANINFPNWIKSPAKQLRPS